MPGEPGIVRRVTHVTAFPEKSQDAGKTRRLRGISPFFLPVLPGFL
jgi:hypothetical protein